MFSRSVCRILPSSYQLVRVSSAQASRQRSFHTTSKLVRTKTSVPRRLYSEQAVLEPAVVDYETIKKATLDSKVLIIDVREPNEIQEHGKIPNSINIPVGDVKNMLSLTEKEFERTFNKPKPSEDTEIIFYCMIGKRSGMAQQSALSLGFKNAKNYLGSWTDWAKKQKA